MPGSIVHTDYWEGYAKLSKDIEFTHHTVNHSIGFMNHQTGTRTNTVEGTWSDVKSNILPKCRL